MKRWVSVFPAAIALLLMVRAAGAEGIDCTKASTSIEVAICSDDTLRAADAAMARLHEQLQQQHPSVQAEQADWLASIRNQCTTDECLAEAYSARIAHLEEMLKEPSKGSIDTPSKSPQVPATQSKAAKQAGRSQEAPLPTKRSNETKPVHSRDNAASIPPAFAGYIIAALVATLVLVSVGYLIYEALYFRSRRFAKLKEGYCSIIEECNDLNDHILELKAAYIDIGSRNFGSGTLTDESRFRFSRTRWSSELKNRFVYNCTAAVCKSASDQPFKYLCKYFGIESNEESLEGIEAVLNDFVAAEQGKSLLMKSRDETVGMIGEGVPWVIRKIRSRTLGERLGLQQVDLGTLYFPTFTFSYVSPGGNSSFSFNLQLNLESLEALVAYLGDLVKYRKSVKGQRALMTIGLREKIKQRDGFTCRMCALSVEREPNLLLEIDHIVPLSKGGITSEKNLQTLCWRCNRSKGAKLID